MGLRTLYAGPSCSLCASGYFRKGKTCAPCDDGTKNVMYANLAADCGAPGEMFVVQLPSSFAQGWALPPDSSARSCSVSLSFTPRLCLPSSTSWQRDPLCGYTHTCTQSHAPTDPLLPSHSPRTRAQTHKPARAHAESHTAPLRCSEDIIVASPIEINASESWLRLKTSLRPFARHFMRWVS